MVSVAGGKLAEDHAYMVETQRHKDTEEALLDNSLSYKIIGAAIEVHRTLGGPGLLESAWRRAYILTVKIKSPSQI